MKSSEMLNQIKTLLNIEVKLEELKLENGTVVEAESFEKGKEIFIKTDDEKVAMPVGEYILEDSRLLVVEEEGIIADMRDVSDEVPQKEGEDGEEITEDLEDDEEMRDDGKEAAVDDWAGMEKRIKNLEDAVSDLKSRFSDKEEMDEDGKGLKSRTVKEEFSEEAAVQPIKHSPEIKQVEKRVFAKSKTRTTLDRVLNKLNK
jgi:hypothetical protein